MSTAFAQSVDDGMDGYVAGTSGIYTGNPILEDPGVCVPFVHNCTNYNHVYNCTDCGEW
jgi:hypothetical protein